MPYAHADNALARCLGPIASGSLPITAGRGAAFAAAGPTADVPLALGVWRSASPQPIDSLTPDGTEQLVGALIVTGASSGSLTVSGAVPGYALPTVQAGDWIADAPLAVHLRSLWIAMADRPTSAAVGGLIDDAIDDLVTTGELAAAVAAREPAIAAGTTGDFWRGDKTWQPLATVLSPYATTEALDAGLAGKQAALTLTTTGASGAATLLGSVLNIPQYGGGGGGSGTVTTVSVATANGFGGSVATATTTPVITIRTTATGLLKGDGTAVSAAVAGTDYVSPSGLTSALATYVALTGAQTLVDKSTQSSGSGDQLKHVNTLGVVASGVDADGNAGGYDLSYLLASGVDLAAGASASRVATWPGKIAEVLIKANVNGASGGFTLVVTKNGTTIATQAVVASNTAVVTIAAGSISDLAIAKGDVFGASCASSPAPGTGVQSVEIYIKHARRNR